MSKTGFIEASLTRSPPVAAAIFAGLILVFAIVSVNTLVDTYLRYADLAATADLLAQLEGRKPLASRNGALPQNDPTGSPYLEGATVTIAGAALLQRVANAVSRHGGNTLSSQLDVQPNPSNPGFVSILSSIEIGQSGLQELLYDLEAGMPFLFIGQLDVQAPESSGKTAGRLRVLLGVSGKWQGAN
jgi:general secretion pathway protein M